MNDQDVLYPDPSNAFNFVGRSLYVRKLSGLNTVPRWFRVGEELF